MMKEMKNKSSVIGKAVLLLLLASFIETHNARCYFGFQ